MIFICICLFDSECSTGLNDILGKLKFMKGFSLSSSSPNVASSGSVRSDNSEDWVDIIDNKDFYNSATDIVDKQLQSQRDNM